MTKSSSSRINRKISSKNNKKQTDNMDATVSLRQFKALVSDAQKLYRQLQLLDKQVFLMMETLSRKGVFGLNDVRETENLFIERDKRRLSRIKELLVADLSPEELIDAIEEDADLPSYERLSINPVQDLNLNPFEVGSIIKERNESLGEEDLLKKASLWGLTPEHLGLKSTGSEQ